MPQSYCLYLFQMPPTLATNHVVPSDPGEELNCCGDHAYMVTVPDR
jgi:hypothetical protein